MSAQHEPAGVAPRDAVPASQDPPLGTAGAPDPGPPGRTITPTPDTPDPDTTGSGGAATSSSGAAHPAETSTVTSSGWWRPELGLALVVFGLGVFVIVGTLDVSAAASQLGVGPRFFPMLVGGAMLVVGAFYVLDVLRGGRGDPEESEDIDAEAPADLKQVGLVSGVFLAFTALLDVLGWIIAGSLLFFGLSVALGAEHRVRAAIIAAVLGVGTYLVFVKGLGVTLPAGLLEGVI